MKRLAALALVLALASGCALNGSPRAKISDAAETYAYAVFALQDTEMALFKAGRVSIDQHRAMQGPIIKALKVGQDLNVAILTWPKDDPVPPAQLRAAISATRQLGETIGSAFGQNVPAELSAKLDIVQNILFVILDTVGGM